MSILTEAAATTAMRAARAGSYGSRIDRHMGVGVDVDGTGGVLEQEFAPCGRFAEVLEMGRWPAEPDGPCVPIRWLVIGKRRDGARLAIALEPVECRGAHDFDGEVNWQHSSLRFWLHCTFLPYAFSPGEAARLELVPLVTFDNPEFHTVGCAVTYDRIFNLSDGEARRFFASDRERGADPTPYASRRASVRAWWLRSPGGRQFAMEVVNHTGAVDANGFHASLECVGVRPAVVISPDGQVAPEESKPRNVEFLGVRRSDSPGYAIAYADEKEALDQLTRSRDTLSTPDARTALSGGRPSVDLMHRLMDRGLIDSAGRWRLALAAIDTKELTLFKRLVREGRFKQGETTQLLNSCVSSGSLDFALALVDSGASGSGYARAYLPSTLSEETAVCAVAVDPVGAQGQWAHVRKFPQAVRMLITSCPQAADLPGVLSVCAENDFMPEVRALLESRSPAITHAVLAQAIQGASAKGNHEMVAFLIDRQAALFGAGPSQTPALTAAQAGSAPSSPGSEGAAGSRSCDGAAKPPRRGPALEL